MNTCQCLLQFGKWACRKKGTHTYIVSQSYHTRYKPLTSLRSYQVCMMPIYPVFWLSYSINPCDRVHTRKLVLVTEYSVLTLHMIVMRLIWQCSGPARLMLDYTTAFPIQVYALSLARLAFLHAVIIIHACIYALPDCSTIPSVVDERGDG